MSAVAIAERPPAATDATVFPTTSSGTVSSHSIRSHSPALVYLQHPHSAHRQPQPAPHGCRVRLSSRSVRPHALPHTAHGFSGKHGATLTALYFLDPDEALKQHHCLSWGGNDLSKTRNTENEPERGPGERQMYIWKHDASRGTQIKTLRFHGSDR